MDKSTFMKELEQSLSVLQEDELKDILSEYEQHVDMKVKSGLTEEEAIADFGNLSELAAEILEAYHVRADYAEGYAGTGKQAPWGRKDSWRKNSSRKNADDLVNGNSTAAEKLESAKGACKNVGEKLMAGAKGAGGWIWGVIRFWVRQLGRPFHWGADVLRRGIDRYKDRRGIFENVLPEEELLGGEDRNVKLLTGGCSSDDTGHVETDGNAIVENGRVRMETCAEKTRNGRRRVVGMLFQRITGLALGGLRLAANTIFWAMRMAWNAFCVGFALSCGMFGVCCLFGFGMLVVLLLQKYPLAGVTVCCFGVMICLFSAAWLGVTLLWRKKTGPAVGQEKHSMEETGKSDKGKEEQYA